MNRATMLDKIRRDDLPDMAPTDFTWGVMHWRELLMFNISEDEAHRVVSNLGYGFHVVRVPVTFEPPRYREGASYTYQAHVVSEVPRPSSRPMPQKRRWRGRKGYAPVQQMCPV